MAPNQLKIRLKDMWINVYARIFLGVVEKLKINGMFLMICLAYVSRVWRNRPVHKCLKFAGGCVMFYAFAIQAAENPHHVSATDKSTCSSCHATEVRYDQADLLDTKNKQVDLTAFNNDGIAMCTGCHNADEGHKVGLKLDFDIPADMPLNKKKTMSCLTCHYTHGSLESTRPQASFSFMDRMVNSERLHKSFLLRRNNVDGELCLTCHK